MTTVRVPKTVMFVKLPARLHSSLGHGCICPWCVEHPTEMPSWDTLAFQLDKDGNQVGDSWAVHHPALKGVETRKSK